MTIDTSWCLLYLYGPVNYHIWSTAYHIIYILHVYLTGVLEEYIDTKPYVLVFKKEIFWKWLGFDEILELCSHDDISTIIRRERIQNLKPSKKPLK